MAVRLDNQTERMGALVLAGPRATAVLEAATGLSLTEDAFPWGTARAIELGLARATALRFTTTGEGGWELQAPASSLPTLYNLLVTAGAAHGIGDVGWRAQQALQLEAGFPREGFDFDTTTTVAEAGFGALMSGEASKPAKRLMRLTVEPGDADPYLNDAVLDGERTVALVASGGHDRNGKGLAFALLPADLAVAGKKLGVEILGKRCAASVAGAAFDGVRLPGVSQPRKAAE
jgi:dimethylglycine dehydrogenase